jgi:hypothetical protein
MRIPVIYVTSFICLLYAYVLLIYNQQSETYFLIGQLFVHSFKNVAETATMLHDSMLLSSGKNKH